jgi:hypothetical protein
MTWLKEKLRLKKQATRGLSAVAHLVLVRWLCALRERKLRARSSKSIARAPGHTLQSIAWDHLGGRSFWSRIFLPILIHCFPCGESLRSPGAILFHPHRDATSTI